MATTHAQNNRASLLSGLRTGGVRSSSAAMPHTAAPGATFNINRYPSQHHTQVFVEEDEAQYLEFQSQQAGYANMNRGIPMTAAVDGPNFSQLMAQRGLNPNSVPFSPMMNQTNHAQNNAFQMQMLQLEMMKIQAAQAQAQQMQAEMYAQSQRQQQAQAARRPSVGYVPPATAGPHNNSFDLRSAALSAQMRRTSQVEQQVKAQLGVGVEDSVPMTAALGGRFGSRAMNAPAPIVRANSGEFNNEPAALPSTPNTTTVISGGTPLGTPSLNGKMVPNATSKSDSVSTWRRGGNNNSVLSGKLRPANPSVTITPPPNEPETQMSSTPTTTKSRPLPLRFSGATTQPLIAVAIDTSEEGEHDDTSSSDSSNSSPSTPSSSTSHGAPPLSPREEASKKLYEGLGIGRPLSSNSIHQPEVPVITVASYRMVSQPTRQPRGPPSGADELGPKNFATRIRRQAIDGLGFLMNSRERRELVEAF